MTACKCDKFFTPSTAPCRLAEPGQPALCGQECRRPPAPEPEPSGPDWSLDYLNAEWADD